MSGESFCVKVLNWIKALWPLGKKSDICKLTDIKSKYVVENMSGYFEYIDAVSLYRIACGDKYASGISDQNPKILFAVKQTFFEMQVLLRVNISSLDGNKPVKTINFLKWNSEKAKNFKPIVLSDENILEVCRKFNKCFVRPRNPQAYQKYKSQIDGLENPSRFFVPRDPKQFYELCQNIIDAAGFTERDIKNMEFSNHKNISYNQQEVIPNLETKKEKNL